MNNFIFVGLFLNFCIFKPGTALYSSKELKIYNVLLKPYGISFKDDLILKVSPDFSKCTDLEKAFENCSSIAVSLKNSTTGSTVLMLKELFRRCPSSSYNCFWNYLNYTVKSDSIFRGWFKKVQTTVGTLCKQQCWKTMQLVTDRCIQESDRRYLQFVNEVLKSLCIQQGGSSCADKFVNGLLKKEPVNSGIEICNVTKNIKKHECSSQCHKDVWNFYNTLGCCIGSVSNIMDCYSIEPESNSYGVFVKDGSKCKLRGVPACTTNPQCPITPQESSTSPPNTNLLEGKQIAGVVIAVLICIGGALIVGNYFYRRMKRKQAIRFEDYGYSRLKMLEDDFYHDVEDDDENIGLINA